MLDRIAAGGKFNYARDCRNGLALEQWLDAQDFSQVLNACAEKSIEVFWRNACAS